jgi:hypothetical protein
MNRMLVWSLVGALIGGGTGAAIAVAGDDEGEIFIASDQPINADQVREKLTSDGWMNIQVGISKPRAPKPRGLRRSSSTLLPVG